MAGLADIALANYTRVVIAGAAVGDDVDVANVQSVGELGDESNIIDVPEYGVKYLRKLVGSANAGPVEVVCNLVDGGATDVGQTFDALQTAYKNGDRLKMRIAMSDATGTDGYFINFTGIVASKSFSNEFDATRTVTWSIAIDGAVSDLLAFPIVDWVAPS